ncbi:hypothetical protein GO988_12330 [Hymenobacter sp. HMF4947]|uniref:DUF4352 domain-containing protein n=1 Tax=Hymenobacter ginkgonis TaxID=2682976 RepID=A0A7K1TFC6_9BACT|nr:hypothetical protein [Hymenobacter ginkgonis]MVN77114.1 hypothetical protein [Hymenobacter ginkgonis]
MKQRFTRSLATFLTSCTLLGSGCAGSYTAIRPDRIASYQASPVGAPLQFNYQFDALRLQGRNKKYAKKEQKKGYHVVAVQVKNTTGAEINFSRDAVLYYGDRPVVPVDARLAAKDMKQGVAIYLLYVLLNPTFTKTTTTNGYVTSSEGSTFYVGPFIAGGNMLGASLANNNFRRELEQYDLTNRIIHPGETVYGLLCLREATVAPLRLELRSVAANTPATPAPAAPATSPAPTTN